MVAATYLACEGMQVCSCLHPRYVDTPNGRVHVPCGNCEACNALKGYSSKTNLDVCLANFVCVYMVTLTYNDEHLPFAVWDDEEFSYVGSDVDYNGNSYSSPFGDWCDDALTSRHLDYVLTRYDGKLPVLSHRDILLFKKRFRKSLFKELNEKVSIYVCGEYAPKNFRPHFHLLLCFKSLVRECDVTRLVHSAWSCRVRGSSSRSPYGFVHVQYCSSEGYSSYVASYLNCSINLPKVLRGKFRPFRQSFRQSEYRSDFVGFEELSYFRKPYFEKPCRDYTTGEYVVARVPSFLQDRVFPRHKAFGLIDIQTRLRITKFVALFPSFGQFYDYCTNAFDGGLALSFIRDVIMYDVRDVRVALYKFWLVFRRYWHNSVSFGCSLLEYFRRLDDFFSQRELFKLRKFYEFLSDFSKTHARDQVLSLYYDSPQYYDYRNLQEFKYFKFLMHKINFVNSKTKKRNSYFEYRGWSRPRFGSSNPKILQL